MRRVWQTTLAAFAVLCAASAAQAQGVFTLSFDSSPAPIRGNAGDTWTAECTAVLGADGSGDGAQGWSISMVADGADISAITIDGTDAKGLFSGGFNKTQVTSDPAGSGKDCAGRNGAVSAVVLSLTEPITLPAPPSSATIAKVSLQGTVPAGGGNAVLRYADGCKGAGQPVDNNITQNGSTVKPSLQSKTISLQEIVSFCNQKLNVGFSSSGVTSDAAYSGIVDSGDGLCTGGGGSIVYEVDESGNGGGGGVGNFHVFVNISSNGADSGAQGWSLSVALDGAFEFGPGGATFTGTPAERLFSGGFKKTEVVDPAKNGGQRGAVSGIVLSLTEPAVLPATGTESVLDLNVMGSSQPTEGSDVTGLLRFLNGLIGAGQPVGNAITVGGGTQPIGNVSTANVALVLRLQPPPAFSAFVRGNANNDGKVDIADPIWIINELFRGGPATACQDAADANDDGIVDAADSVYLVNYLFRGGSQPGSPFPTCDFDPTDDNGDADPSNDLACPAGSVPSCP